MTIAIPDRRRRTSAPALCLSCQSMEFSTCGDSAPVMPTGGRSRSPPPLDVQLLDSMPRSRYDGMNGAAKASLISTGRRRRWSLAARFRPSLLTRRAMPIIAGEKRVTPLETIGPSVSAELAGFCRSDTPAARRVSGTLPAGPPVGPETAWLGDHPGHPGRGPSSVHTETVGQGDRGDLPVPRSRPRGLPAILCLRKPTRPFHRG